MAGADFADMAGLGLESVALGVDGVKVWDLRFGMELGKPCFTAGGDGLDGSNVRALRIGIGLGDTLGVEFGLAGHLSNTDFFVSSFSGVERGLFAFPLLSDSRFELTLIMFCTNPLPCKRLILGVTSFEGGDLRNAGDAL